MLFSCNFGFEKGFTASFWSKWWARRSQLLYKIRFYHLPQNEIEKWIILVVQKKRNGTLDSGDFADFVPAHAVPICFFNIFLSSLFLLGGWKQFFKTYSNNKLLDGSMCMNFNSCFQFPIVNDRISSTSSFFFQESHVRLEISGNNV